MLRKHLFLYLLTLLQAQDTLRITLAQADSLFLTRSYYLLAASMNIEAQKAKLVQAKLYPNPIFTADLNAYDPQSDKVFNVGSTGQKIFQIEQLIILGGKRKSEIEMAKTQVRIAELEFEFLVRRLKFQLHKSLFMLWQYQTVLSYYHRQLVLLDTLLGSYQSQVDKGNIPLKELVRLKGAYLKLINDRAPFLMQYYQALQTVQTLLQTNSPIEFILTEEEIQRYIKLYPLEELEVQALQHRSDFLRLKEDRVLAQQFFSYQRQLAIPDVTFFAYYDQAGAAFPNQISAGVSFPLPLWNRNQGNIKASYLKMQEVEYNLQAMQNEILSNLRSTYQFYMQTLGEYQKVSALFGGDFDVALAGVIESFERRNISTLEFADFLDTYNRALQSLSRVKSQLMTLAEELNFLVGREL